MKLLLGVIDMPYVAVEPQVRQARKKAKRGPHAAHAAAYVNQTTGNVAELLENKYHVFEHFWERHQVQIVEALQDSFAGAFESVVSGAPPRNDLYGSGTSAIEEMFRRFLSQGEMDSLGYPGIPTKAARAGVSHRFANPYAKRPERPSFVDTGLYEASMKAEIEEQTMVSAVEGAQARQGIAANLAEALDTLSLEQEVTFVQYLKVVLPLDGFVFWVRADLLGPSALYNAAMFNAAAMNGPPGVVEPAPSLTVKGSLHHDAAKQQNEAETLGINQVIFTAETEVVDFNAVGPSRLYIARIGAEQIRYAFSQRRSFYRQAALYHYVGTALYPALASQVIDDIAQFDDRQPVVSNSLPLWLALNTPSALAGTLSLPVLLYPSFAIPDNLDPPYGVVHIDPERTVALQPVPRLGRTLSHQQLVQDRVRITLYGLRNAQALDVLDAVESYSLNTDNFGVMNMPAVRDGKRPQVEFGILAMEKFIDFDVSYFQYTARHVARQIITAAVPTYVIQDAF